MSEFVTKIHCTYQSDYSATNLLMPLPMDLFTIFKGYTLTFFFGFISLLFHIFTVCLFLQLKELVIDTYNL